MPGKGQKGVFLGKRSMGRGGPSVLLLHPSQTPQQTFFLHTHSTSNVNSILREDLRLFGVEKDARQGQKMGPHFPLHLPEACLASLPRPQPPPHARLPHPYRLLCIKANVQKSTKCAIFGHQHRSLSAFCGRRPQGTGGAARDDDKDDLDDRMGPSCLFIRGHDTLKMEHRTSSPPPAAS